MTRLVFPPPQGEYLKSCNRFMHNADVVIQQQSYRHICDCSDVLDGYDFSVAGGESKLASSMNVYMISVVLSILPKITFQWLSISIRVQVTFMAGGYSNDPIVLVISIPGETLLIFSWRACCSLLTLTSNISCIYWSFVLYSNTNSTSCLIFTGSEIGYRLPYQRFFSIQCCTELHMWDGKRGIHFWILNYFLSISRTSTLWYRNEYSSNNKFLMDSIQSVSDWTVQSSNWVWHFDFIENHPHESNDSTYMNYIGYDMSSETSLSSYSLWWFWIYIRNEFCVIWRSLSHLYLFVCTRWVQQGIFPNIVAFFIFDHEKLSW